MILVGVIALAVFANVCAYAYLRPALPDVDTLLDVRMQVPLRIYTRDGRLIAAIGEQRRIPVRYEQIPPLLVKAFLAAEDDRFFKHHGVDWQGILRATLANARAGGVRQGGSTITMQVARDVFLTPKRDLKRKMSEIYISLLMESQFSKEDIFTIYANKTFLGQRSYGVAAAAEVYFGKSLGQLTLSEMAIIAGIPKAPSELNPVAGGERTRVRRAYVLRRMLELGYISQVEHDQATAAPVEARLHGPSVEVDAPYVAEMARAEALARYGESIYNAGYKVYTTIDSRLQRAGTIALRTGLLEYDRRHGYRGPVAKIAVPKSDRREVWDSALEEFPIIGGLRPALVQDVEARSAHVFVRGLGFVTLPWEKISWARRELPDAKVDRAPTAATEVFKRGDVIYTAGTTAEALQFVQVPEAQSALVAVDPKDGAVAAVVGGFDFFQSKFNRATQARRQPGSAFKPFVYAAALDKGFTPASVILDAPIVYDDPNSDKEWRPGNSTNKFYGPTRLREALVRSRNLVSVRLMREMGGTYTLNYLPRFGFDKSQLPNNLTLALGTGVVTPLQLATSYSPFANGGFRVSSYFIERIEDAAGKILSQAKPKVACFACVSGGKDEHAAPREDDMPPALRFLLGDNRAAFEHATLPNSELAPQAIRPQVAYLLADMMADVIKRGTGRRALSLNRPDIAGKTGTTNDHMDAWFSGFNGDLVATVWVGFDSERSLGDGEEGARVAVPTWVYFMHEALQGVPPHPVPVPDGLVTVRISPETGLLASADNPNGIMETFIEGNLPRPETYEGPAEQNPLNDGDKPLF
ncbi:MAG: penicillin-binding protein 1A [Proteobacteria bacterium]|nr:penicillin-binding protein 1A [Pseudomonadota bacterium]